MPVHCLVPHGSHADINCLRSEVFGLRVEIACRRLALLVRKYGYDPSQPRNPRGSEGAGRWTDGPSNSRDDRIRVAQIGPPRNAPPGLVASRYMGRVVVGTPAQMTRLMYEDGRAEEAIGRVRQIERNWRPMINRDSWTSTVEGEIADAESRRVEAEARLRELGDPVVRGRATRACITDESGEWIGRVEGRARPWVRTLEPSEMRSLVGDLLTESRPIIDFGSSYQGRVFLRFDGTYFGLRWSTPGGESVDMFHPFFETTGGALRQIKFHIGY